MRRFAQNRWWIFILTLSVLLASSVTVSSPSYAGEGPDPIEIGGPAPGGDPDSPSGPTKRGPGSGRLTPSGNRYAVTSVGDGSLAQSGWIWRFHVVLRSLVIRHIR